VAIVYKCDRCGAVVEDSKRIEDFFGTLKWDLCKGCLEALKKFMKSF